jgi:hypothetical protein
LKEMTLFFNTRQEFIYETQGMQGMQISGEMFNQNERV